MAAGDVILDVRAVSQKLGGNQILRDCAFKVLDRVRPGQVTGQITGLLGPSGVGKTRLLRLIAGLDVPDAGTVVDGAGKPIRPGSVGVVFQNYPLLRHRTVIDNLIAAAEMAGLERAKAALRARELLERFDLVSRAHAYPVQLSGGQRQRVAIAQQLMRQPTALLMDEPFSGLDPAALDAVMSLLVEVANMHELNTIVLVTHDIRAAMVVCDTLLLLGRDRTPEGSPIPGAYIQASYDMVERGLCWRPDVEKDAAFPTLERELRDRFKTL